MNKIAELLKKFVNKFRIPSLINFIFPDNKAPESDQNTWDRLGLSNKAFGSVPVWAVLLLPIIMVLIKWGAGLIQFGISLISNILVLISPTPWMMAKIRWGAEALNNLVGTSTQFLGIGLLLVFGYLIIKSIKK